MRTESVQDQTIAALSVCPLLLPVTSIVTGIVMGVIFAISLFLTGMLVYLLRGMIPSGIRLYLITLLAATVVGVIHMSAMALWYEISLLFGIYFPLIALNCMLLINNEEVILRRSFSRAIADTVRTAAIMILLLMTIGLIREVFGAGTLFHHAGLLFGESADIWTVRLVDERLTWQVLLSAPGALFAAGLAFAIYKPGDSRSSIPSPA